jgi:hypothetical protein
MSFSFALSSEITNAHSSFPHSFLACCSLVCTWASWGEWQRRKEYTRALCPPDYSHAFCFLSLSLSLFVFSSDITVSLIFWPISLLEQQPCPNRSRVNIFSILDVALADHFKGSWSNSKNGWMVCCHIQASRNLRLHVLRFYACHNFWNIFKFWSTSIKVFD